MMILKKGSQVKIITGKDKGKTGEILEISRSSNRVKIKAINIIKKHLKPTKENKGGIISKENFTSSGEILLPSENLASFLILNATQDLSGGTFTPSAIKPY